MKIVITEGENLHIGFRNFSEIFRKGVAYGNIFRKTTAGERGSNWPFSAFIGLKKETCAIM